MTIQELVDWCNENGVDLNTQIALRAKDDYFLTSKALYLDKGPYFGNCPHGDSWLEQNAAKDDNGDIDEKKRPNFLIMDTFSG